MRVVELQSLGRVGGYRDSTSSECEFDGAVPVGAPSEPRSRRTCRGGSYIVPRDALRRGDHSSTGGMGVIVR